MDRGDAVNSGTIDEGGANSLAIIAQNEHEVVYRFTGIVGWGEVGNLLDDDAEPVFDDMAGLGEIDADDEMWLSEENLYVGRVFGSKQKLQLTLAMNSVRRQYRLKLARSNPIRLEYTYKDSMCLWKLTAYIINKTKKFKIITVGSVHTCDIDTRKKYNKHASPKLVAQLLDGKYNNVYGGPRAVELPHMMLQENNIRILYHTAWRATEKVVDKVRGDEEESYRFLPTYLYLLRKANPGTIYHIYSTPEVDGKSRFKYLFVALGASIRGIKYMRKVLIVDVTYLTGCYKGVLLIACAQDGNFQIFPIAFGIVDGKTDASRVWFFAKLSEIIDDSEDLCVVSDRHSSIYKGLHAVYPRATHGACVVHLERNIANRYCKFGVPSLFLSASKVFTESEFKMYFDELKLRSPGCATFLEDIGFEHWSRAYCMGARFNMMTSTIEESFNAVISLAKIYPIVWMVEFLRSVLMRWFDIRRVKGKKSNSLVTDEVDIKYLAELPASRTFSVLRSSERSYQVTAKDGSQFHVVLDDMTCTCKVYDRLKIPCEHALAAATEFNIDVKTVVGWWYKRQTFPDNYDAVILPTPKSKDVNLPDSLKETHMIPSSTRRPPERPPSKRYPSIGEKG